MSNRDWMGEQLVQTEGLLCVVRAPHTQVPIAALQGNNAAAQIDRRFSSGRAAPITILQPTN